MGQFLALVFSEAYRAENDIIYLKKRTVWAALGFNRDEWCCNYAVLLGHTVVEDIA